MTKAELVAIGLALLGCWGVYTGRGVWKMTGKWAALRWQIVTTGLVMVVSCFVCAAGLWWGWFRSWMLLPLGASYAAMIPLPCYFEAVDRIGWLHAARNVLFALIAILCAAVAVAGMMSR